MATEGPDKASVLNEVDFELTLVHKDDINLGYILRLLGGFGKLSVETAEKKKKQKVMRLLDSQLHLRSKRELIHSFIESSLPKLGSMDDLAEELDVFLQIKKNRRFATSAQNSVCIPID